MDVCAIGEIAIRGNSACIQIQNCYIVTRMPSIVSQEKAFESTELHTDTHKRPTVENYHCIWQLK